MSKKRLRIFAGPNGSGKSTIFSAVDKKVGCKYFVNADEIYKSLSETGCLSFDYYTILPQEDSLKEAFRTSGFYDKSRSGEDIISRLTVENNVLHVPRESVDSYFAAFIADFLRFNMLNIVRQFTIETVMSDVRKMDYIRLAKQSGYRIYLYFVSTQDVEINIGRVAQRVQLGGHDVPREKSYAVIPNRWKTFTIASSCATGPISSIIVLRSGGCSRNTMQKAVLCPYWRKAFRSGSMNMFCGNLHNPVEPKNNNKGRNMCFCPCFIHKIQEFHSFSSSSRSAQRSSV